MTFQEKNEEEEDVRIIDDSEEDEPIKEIEHRRDWGKIIFSTLIGLGVSAVIVLAAFQVKSIIATSDVIETTHTVSTSDGKLVDITAEITNEQAVKIVKSFDKVGLDNIFKGGFEDEVFGANNVIMTEYTIHIAKNFKVENGKIVYTAAYDEFSLDDMAFMYAYMIKKYEMQDKMLQTVEELTKGDNSKNKATSIWAFTKLLKGTD